MRVKSCTIALAMTMAIIAHAAAPIELELATERGLQTTAPQEWLQLLTTAGADHVRIRGGARGDQPRITSHGSAERPRYHVLGVLTSREQLQLPGGVFSRNDRAKLRDYFERLASEGPAGVTAERGRFGLTERQFTAIHADLSQPLRIETKGRPIGEIVDQLRERCVHEIDVPRSLATLVVNDDVQMLTAGTGLALLLRERGYALQPIKPRGADVEIHIVPLAAVEADDVWPVGWEADARPRELAPKLFTQLNAEIAGYSLAEALAALAPRIGVPLFIDHHTLAEREIDADQLQVSFARQRTYHKRVLDRLLFQARLKGELRVDEAGTVFYWVTR